MSGSSNRFTGSNRGQMFQARQVDHVEFHAAPATPGLTALAGLPPVTPLFRGRADQVADLHAAWASGDGPFVVASGLAGIGKTEFVLYAAHRALDDGMFPGQALFIDLQGYDDQRRVAPSQALDNFLRALGVRGADIPPEEAQRAVLFRSLLAEQPPMLIVLDNASSAEQVRPLLPGTAKDRVVITSRHTLASLEGARHIDVGLLSEADAVALVGNAELAHLCGRLPLALRIMKALITLDPHTDWARELRNTRTRLDLLDDGDSRPVHAAFALSCRALTDEQQRLFRLLALHPGDKIELGGACALIGLSEPRTRNLLRELRRAHLLEDSTPPGWYQFHDLVRLYAHKLLEDEPWEQRDAAATRVLEHYAAVCAAAESHLSRTVRPEERSEIFGGWAHALSWLDEHRGTLVAAVAMATETGNHRITLRFGDDMWFFLEFRQLWSDAASVHKNAVTSARQLGDEHEECFALANLAGTYREMDLVEDALAAYRKSLAISRRLGIRREESRALHGLALTLCDDARPDEAMPFITEALTINRALGDRNSIAHSLLSMGYALLWREKLDEAAGHYEEALALFRETADRPNVAWTLSALGSISSDAGRWADAVPRFRESIKIARELGNRHTESATLVDLARAYVQLGQAREAKATIRAALALYQEMGDEEGAQIARELLSDPAGLE